MKNKKTPLQNIKDEKGIKKFMDNPKRITPPQKEQDRINMKELKEQKARLKQINELKPQYDKKARARFLAYKYIKIPKGFMCVICNEELAKERHHKDYSRALEVELVCKKCHRILDKIKQDEDIIV